MDSQAATLIPRAVSGSEGTLWMISPSVRRITLGRELEVLRERAQMTHKQLAKAAGIAQSKISNLENGRIRPDEQDVINILRALGAAGNEWDDIMSIAHEAGQRGWWERSASRMGRRQARTADLEAGAVRIREYATTYPPGLLQIESYTRALSEWDDLARGEDRSDPDAMVQARATRQSVQQRPGGPEYEVILDEASIRRPSAPLDVFAAQLRHMAETRHARVRVLPVGAKIEHWTVPRSAWSQYDYRDERDPVVINVDTVTTDLMVTDPDQIERYNTLYARLEAAALPVQDSAELLRRAADEIEG